METWVLGISERRRWGAGSVGVGSDAFLFRLAGLRTGGRNAPMVGLRVALSSSSLWSWTRFMWSNRLYLRGNP